MGRILALTSTFGLVGGLLAGGGWGTLVVVPLFASAGALGAALVNKMERG